MSNQIFKKLLVKILLGRNKSYISLVKINGKTYKACVTEWFDAAAWAKKAVSALNLGDD
ncbi:hypothetical protein [Faecalispora anaeroviscerum]|uniref:hypothetical protein n=1 Tax=Faecalispora anaeroviscerum TaxID=2991836 RepID=UPI0024BB5A56|nr:hypothetical protein [Faecalispora anaeroviscerum]